MIVLTTAMIVPLVAMGQGSKGSWAEPGFLVPLAIVIATAIVNLLTATSVRAFAGPNGVTVHFGVFGWPRFRYAADRIARPRPPRSRRRGGHGASGGRHDAASC